MKVASFAIDTVLHVGLVDAAAGRVRPFELPVHLAERGVLALIEWQNATGQLPPTGAAVSLDDVGLMAPMPRPGRNLFCVGKNYREHAHEFANSGFDSSAAQGALPEHPIIFSKVPESVIGPGVPIQIDASVSSAVDYEVELAVIIGRGGRGISPERALEHVWGYTIVNDVTARDLQGRHSQWLIGKSQDTFCPMGPWAVTREEVDLGHASVRCWVNDELRQDSNTGLLIFDVPTLIATLSEGITLVAGDVIATGTPAGVGIGFDPPRYLAAGDVVKLEIEGIGELVNPVANRG